MDEIKKPEIPETAYDEIEIVKNPADDIVEDPFFEGEMNMALESLVANEGGEPGFDKTWELSKTRVAHHIDNREYNVALHQMLEMEKACYEDRSEIPEDFRSEFNRAFDMLVLDTFKAIAHRDYGFASEVLDALDNYASKSFLVDRTLQLELSKAYSRELKAEINYQTIDQEAGTEVRGPEEEIELTGPEQLRDAYMQLIAERTQDRHIENM